MSYAFNYSYYLQDLLQGMDQPMLSPIPMGVFGAVDTLNAPIYNVTFTHQILLATGIPQQHGLTAANSTADWDSVVANLHHWPSLIIPIILKVWCDNKQELYFNKIWLTSELTFP